MFATVNTQGYVDQVFNIDKGDNSIELPDAATLDNAYRYKRVDNAWTDGFVGVADGIPLMDAYTALQTTWFVAARKLTLLPIIKTAAERQIVATNWKVERATEVDAATGSTTLAAVYVERAAIRTASNAKETALAALTTYEELDAFNPEDF